MSSPMNLIVLVMLTFAALAPLVSAQTCPVEDKLRVTVTLPPAFGFYNLLDVTADPADVDFNNRQCCRDCRSTPFALYLPPISRTLVLDPAFPNRLVVNSDRSAILTMTVFDRLDVAVRFSARFDLGGFSDTCSEAKLELRSTCYSPTTGFRVDPACFQCWSSVTGTITALPGSAYAGAVLSATRFMNEPQFGRGANGKNSHLGLSFWFSYSVVSPADVSIPGVRPLPSIPADAHGDVNIDVIPPPPVVEPPQFKGDPHFIGFCSNVPTCRYDFHGERNRVFAIISDRNLQLNALFVGADLRPQKIFKTYIGAIGLRAPSTRIRVACDRDSERHVIEVDGQELASLTVYSFDTPEGTATVSRDDQDRISIDLPRYFLKLRFSSSAHSSCHINMRANYRAVIDQNGLLTSPNDLTPHGVLGQTADPTRNFPTHGTGPQGDGIVEGRWQDYLIENDDLFGTQFAFSRWSAESSGQALASSDDADESFPERKRILYDTFADTIHKMEDDEDYQRHDDDNIVEKSAAVH